LHIVGFIVAMVGLMLGLLGSRGFRRTAPLASSSGILFGTIFLGLATAAALGMNYVNVFGDAFGSPISETNPVEFSPYPRAFWAILLVIVAIPAFAVLAHRSSRAVSQGLVIGLAVVVLAIAFFRLGEAFAFGESHGSEGTWTFVAAGPALVLLLGYDLWGRRATTARSR
jgi:hypothetical protein